MADAFVVLLPAARFHWSLFCHLFLLFLYSSVRLPLETLLWHESIRGMSAIRIEVHGFDVSHHQGQIDWSELQKTQTAPFPVRFVFMKASEGGDFSDTAFIHNFDEPVSMDLSAVPTILQSQDRRFPSGRFLYPLRETGIGRPASGARHRGEGRR